jgi:ADP-ribosylglycohydrolase
MANVLLATLLKRHTSSSTAQVIDTDAVIAAYDNWFKSGDAFDFGTVFGCVFQERLRRAALSGGRVVPLVQGSADAIGSSLSPECSLVLPSISRADHDGIVRAVFERTSSAGVNPAHRNVVLSLANIASVESIPQLAAAAAAEAQLTHLHPSSVWTSVTVNVLCRHIVQQGAALRHAVDQTVVFLEERARDGGVGEADVQAILEIRELLSLAMRYTPPNYDSISWLHRGGYSPKVLGTALFFVASTKSFQDALEQSLAFAGSENYCPVLVGAIAGALYGADSIPAHALQHPMLTSVLLESVRKQMMAAASTWEKDRKHSIGA